MSADIIQGLLLIPNISGVEQFVTEVELIHSEHIISELMELLIRENRIGLRLSDLDGNALVFFGESSLPDHGQLMDQIQAWTTAFHGHLNLIRRDTFCKCGVCQNLQDFGLHIIGHHGEFGLNFINGKSVIIGKEVILARRLAEISLAPRDYFLMSKPLMDSLPGGQKAVPIASHFEELPVFGNLELGVMDLDPVRHLVSELVPADFEIEFDREMVSEIDIETTLQKAVGVVADIPNWSDWIDGLTRQEINPNSPLRLGHHHVCVIQDNPIDVTVAAFADETEQFQLVMKFKPPLPIVKDLYVKFRIVKTDRGVRVSQTTSYNKRVIVGRLFDLTGARKLGGHAERSMVNLKNLLEK